MKSLLAIFVPIFLFAFASFAESNTLVCTGISRPVNLVVALNNNEVVFIRTHQTISVHSHDFIYKVIGIDTSASTDEKVVYSIAHFGRVYQATVDRNILTKGAGEIEFAGSQFRCNY